MGVRSETYILLGIKLDIAKEKIQDTTEQERLGDLGFGYCGKNAEKSMGCLYDGMGGGYWVAGYCYRCITDEYGIPLTKLQSFEDKTIELWCWLKEQDLVKYVIPGETAELIILSHYH
jgi:hypothetical protein